MKHLKINTNLEACGMGNNQEEIAEWVSNCDEWIAFLSHTNVHGIPANEDGARPCDEWFAEQDFLPDDMIVIACEALGWKSVPDTGGLIMTYYEAS